MVSVAGAISAVSLASEYQVLSQSIAAAQQAIGAGAAMQFLECQAQINNVNATLSAPTPLSPTDTATVLNGLVAIWTAMQAAITAQLGAIS